MATQSQKNEVATSLLKLKRQLGRLGGSHRLMGLTECIRQLQVQKEEEEIKAEQKEAHRLVVTGLRTGQGS